MAQEVVADVVLDVARGDDEELPHLEAEPAADDGDRQQGRGITDQHGRAGTVGDVVDGHAQHPWADELDAVAPSAPTRPSEDCALVAPDVGQRAAAAPSKSRSPVYEAPDGRASGQPIAGRRSTDTWARASRARIPMTRRLTLLLTLAGCLVATTADAQFNRRDPATGEVYKIELGYGWWRPNPTIIASSDGSRHPGDAHRFRDRPRHRRSTGSAKSGSCSGPPRKHKFRFDYLPIDYIVEGHILNREIVFNGQSFTVGLPVNVDAGFRTI